MKGHRKLLGVMDILDTLIVVISFMDVYVCEDLSNHAL